jgi:multisubunit Na+/H+ antiporter MnhG subunit
MSFLAKNISITQCKDSGLALVLVSLVLAIGLSPKIFLPAGIGFLVVAMTAPGLFRPFAKLWFGLSHTLGAIVSRILLTLLFYVLVTPVGLIRRALGKDAMQINKWKKGTGSVFHDRDHLVKPQDLDHPY